MLKVNKAEIICYVLTSLISVQKGNVGKYKELIKIVNIEEKILHVF